MMRTIGRKGRYLKHGRDGRITDNQSKGRCIVADKRNKTLTVPLKRQGYKGDHKIPLKKLFKIKR